MKMKMLMSLLNSLIKILSSIRIIFYSNKFKFLNERHQIKLLSIKKNTILKDNHKDILNQDEKKPILVDNSSLNFLKKYNNDSFNNVIIFPKRFLIEKKNHSNIFVIINFENKQKITNLNNLMFLFYIWVIFFIGCVIILNKIYYLILIFFKKMKLNNKTSSIVVDDYTIDKINKIGETISTSDFKIKNCLSLKNNNNEKIKSSRFSPSGLFQFSNSDISSDFNKSRVSNYFSYKNGYESSPLLTEINESSNFFKEKKNANNRKSKNFLLSNDKNMRYKFNEYELDYFTKKKSNCEVLTNIFDSNKKDFYFSSKNNSSISFESSFSNNANFNLDQNFDSNISIESCSYSFQSAFNNDGFSPEFDKSKNLYINSFLNLYNSSSIFDKKNNEIFKLNKVNEKNEEQLKINKSKKKINRSFNVNHLTFKKKKITSVSLDSFFNNFSNDEIFNNELSSDINSKDYKIYSLDLEKDHHKSFETSLELDFYVDTEVLNCDDLENKNKNEIHTQIELNDKKNSCVNNDKNDYNKKISTSKKFHTAQPVFTNEKNYNYILSNKIVNNLYNCDENDSIFSKKKSNTSLGFIYPEKQFIKSFNSNTFSFHHDQKKKKDLVSDVKLFEKLNNSFYEIAMNKKKIKSINQKKNNYDQSSIIDPIDYLNKYQKEKSVTVSGHVKMVIDELLNLKKKEKLRNIDKEFSIFFYKLVNEKFKIFLVQKIRYCLFLKNIQEKGTINVVVDRYIKLFEENILNFLIFLVKTQNKLSNNIIFLIKDYLCFSNKKQIEKTKLKICVESLLKIVDDVEETNILVNKCLCVIVTNLDNSMLLHYFFSSFNDILKITKLNTRKIKIVFDCIKYYIIFKKNFLIKELVHDPTRNKLMCCGSQILRDLTKYLKKIDFVLKNIENKSIHYGTQKFLNKNMSRFPESELIDVYLVIIEVFLNNDKISPSVQYELLVNYILNIYNHIVSIIKYETKVLNLPN